MSSLSSQIQPACRFSNSAALASVVRKVVPRSKDGIDSATRTFQALRILVNREIEQLDAWLAALPDALALGGVAIAISFHSLEDRPVKQRFRALTQARPHPDPFAPGRVEPPAELLTKKPRTANAIEIEQNPRARSAKLRALRRIR